MIVYVQGSFYQENPADESNPSNTSSWRSVVYLANERYMKVTCRKEPCWKEAPARKEAEEAAVEKRPGPGKRLLRLLLCWLLYSPLQKGRHFFTNHRKC